MSRSQSMSKLGVSLGGLALGLSVAVSVVLAAHHEKHWEVHDMDRPPPATVTPAGPVTTAPPEDAIVLFDGNSLGKWLGNEDSPAAWTIAQGAATVTKTGSIRTRESFGDCQLHIEFALPDDAENLAKEGQKRGNSGVFFMGRYEVQILDSYNNRTYADGQCASLYGQYPPLVNASLAPGRWQSFDIVFRRPRFDEAGNMTKPAIVTVFQNGILVQDHTEMTGATAHKREATYAAHADALPLMLQEHGDPVKFRNIWIRPLE